MQRAAAQRTRPENSYSNEDKKTSETSAFSTGGAPRPFPKRQQQMMTGGLTHYCWYNEYVELTKRYRWQVAAYIAWCASPVVGREPKTQQELAVVLGYKTDRTLRLWKEQDPTIAETIAVLQAAPLWGHRRDIYEALVRSALLEGSAGHSDRKLALELLGDYVPRSKQAVEATVTAVPFTADELAQAELELGEWGEDDKMTG